MNKQDKRAAQERAEAGLKQLTKSLASLDRNGDLMETQIALSKLREDGDEHYQTVRKKLSGTSADAQFVKTLVRISCATAKRINSTAKVFNLSDKLLKLKRIHRSELELARFLTTNYASDAICYPPTFEYFYGAIRHQPPVVGQRKKRARMQLDDPAANLTKATERNIRTDCEQDSTPKEVEAIHAKIKQLSEAKPTGVQFLTAIVDPESYPHTVENIFHTAFLVKEGKVGLNKGNGSKPLIALAKEDVKPKDRRCSQSIFSFSMADYKKWVAALNK